MSGQAAIYGRLGADPVQRTSQAGKTWATASLAVDLGAGEDQGEATVWFGIVAFSRTAEALCRHSKGDLLSVGGRLQVNRWRDNQGREQEKLQVIAEAVISARAVRPGGGRRRPG
jgi:single stranded DNA-binding protein